MKRKEQQADFLGIRSAGAEKKQQEAEASCCRGDAGGSRIRKGRGKENI